MGACNWPGCACQRLVIALTAREQQLLEAMLLNPDMGTKQLAHFIGVAPKTADVHRSNLFRKLGVSNRLELTILALKRGVIGLDRFADPSPDRSFARCA